MTTNRFFHTHACNSRNHCGACRSRGPHGRTFRGDVDRIFKTGVDFECPFGVPWGVEGGEPPPPPTPEMLAAIERRQSEAWTKLGPLMWAELHTKEGADQAFLDEFATRIPCGDCRAHWREMVARTPPVFGVGWFAWTVERHNEVNTRLGKATMTVEDARSRWDAVRSTQTPTPMTVGRAIHGALGIAKALTGTGGADDELVKHRTAICTTCEYAELTAGVLSRCGLCGCATWAKVRNADEKCPAGKW